MTKRDTDIPAAVTAEQLAEWKRLAEAATPGPWKSRGMGGDSVVLMPITSHRIGYAGDPTLCSLAEPRRFEDRDGKGFTDTSAGFLHDDARLVAAARTAVPALVREVERLWERLECAHAYQSVDGKMTRIAVEVGSMPDGIECRDETIRLHDRHIDELRSEIGRLRGLLRRALPSVEADALMMDAMDRHSPLPAEDMPSVTAAANDLDALAADIRAALPDEPAK